MCDDGVLWMNI